MPYLLDLLLTLNKDVKVIATIVLVNNGVSHKTCCNLCDNRSVERVEARLTESKGRHPINEAESLRPKKLRSSVKRASSLDSYHSNNDASIPTTTSPSASNKVVHYACVIFTEAPETPEKGDFYLVEKMVKQGSSFICPLADNL